MSLLSPTRSATGGSCACFALRSCTRFDIRRSLPWGYRPGMMVEHQFLANSPRIWPLDEQVQRPPNIDMHQNAHSSVQLMTRSTGVSRETTRTASSRVWSRRQMTRNVQAVAPRQSWKQVGIVADC